MNPTEPVHSLAAPDSAGVLDAADALDAASDELLAGDAELLAAAAVVLPVLPPAQALRASATQVAAVRPETILKLRI
ncbi:MAG: hypothetical protein ABI382_09240 [Nakamurella sp.]